MRIKTIMLSAAAIGCSFMSTVSIPLLRAQQAITAQGTDAEKTATPASTVYSNPRTGSDDPRDGLKPGLYDAGEAAFGIEKLASQP